MAPTIEKKPKRIYCVQREPGNTIRVHADTMCRDKNKLIFKREDEIVGEVQNGDLDWWIEEVDSK